MDKLIDHARAVHLTLIGVCAVVVVFASTGDTPREAREAIRALEQIQHLDIDAFSKSVTATLRQHLDRDGFSAGLKRVSEATGVPIELTNVEFDETAGVKDLATAIKSKTLLELREYLTKDHPVTVEMPDAPALFAILTTALPQFKPVLERNANTYRLRWYIGANRPQDGRQLHLDWPDEDPQQRSFGIRHFEQLRAPAVARAQVESLSINQWVTSQLLVRDPLATVQPFWPELKDQRLDLAILSLRVLESRESGTLELLGVKVPARLAALAGSMACLLLMLYLATQLTQLTKLLMATDSTFDLPWFAMYGDRLSSALAYASVTAAPLLSVCFLVYRTFNVADVGSWASTATLVGIVITSVMLVRAMRRSRALATRLFTVGDAVPQDDKSK
ncbi:MAG: hypothetical protein ABL921_35905 [Pirellula sp.]